MDFSLHIQFTTQFPPEHNLTEDISSMLVRLKRSKRGFTLVELMIVVAIIGVLAALAIYGVQRYIASAKSAEAKEMVGGIAKAAVIAYDREGMAGTILQPQGSATGTHSLCDSASPVPASVPASAKYQSAESEWRAGSDTAGWRCLKFSISGPQYYQYNYTRSNATSFDSWAFGNLDDDSVTSSFRLQGAVQGGLATFSPNFIESNPDE